MFVVDPGRWPIRRYTQPDIISKSALAAEGESADSRDHRGQRPIS